MYSLLLLGGLLSVEALSIRQYNESNTESPVDCTRGFTNAITKPSVGGAATCVEGIIPVTASAMNTLLKYPNPLNQSMITETIVEYLQVNATLPMAVLGAKTNVSGTWDINAKLCFPANSTPSSTVQFLTHGVGFDGSYWDFYSEDYSYQNAAALKGYTTFSYDRLGTGSSAHPDPIQTVQTPLELAIAHSLIQSLRSGAIASTSFTKLIGVGHSLGSELTSAVTANYPSDLDAAVLTGFSDSSSMTGQMIFFGGLDLQIASINQPFRFADLPNGYLISDDTSANQFGFFRSPNFDPKVLVAAEATKQTFTIGELFTNTMLMGTAKNFTGPVFVIDGENDLPFCQGNCLLPEDQAANAVKMVYPAASNSSSSYIAAGAGHGLNLHYVAGTAYQQIFQFISKAGF